LEPFAYNLVVTAMDRLHQLSRCFAALSLMAVLVAPSSSIARYFTVPGCEAAEQLADGSWLISSSNAFGLAGKVSPGSIVLRGTVIDGVDLGLLLDTRCFRRYALEPDYPPYLWAPNGYPNIVVPLP
jgi:hypothetical protein